LRFVAGSKTVAKDTHNNKAFSFVKNDESDSETDVDWEYSSSQTNTGGDVWDCEQKQASDELHKCIACGQQFNSAMLLVQHTETAQICGKCGKKFKSCTRLKAHRLACILVKPSSGGYPLQHQMPGKYTNFVVMRSNTTS
jgi:hypothetical protein